MKAITIIQPWATLIALGEKKFETRSWATKHRGNLAIHAGKKVDKAAFMNETIYMTLRNHGILTVNDLPTGVVVAIANLTDCLEVIGGDGSIAELRGRYILVSGNEFAFGNYEEGRFAWHMNDIQRLQIPISVKGQQGLWNWNIPIVTEDMVNGNDCAGGKCEM